MNYPLAAAEPNISRGENSFLVTVEGGDGCGKATQAKRLAERALGMFDTILEETFPQYESESSLYVRRYLNGAYGKAQDVHPDLASAIFTLDRVQAAPRILKKLSLPNTLVICDRYVDSNAAHQGTKIADYLERMRYYSEIFGLEYDVLGIPKPNFTVILDVSTDTAFENVSRKGLRSYTELTHDVHEEDPNHQELAKRNYAEIADLYPSNHERIDCMDGTSMRTIDEISEDIAEAFNNFLARQN